MGDSSSSHSSPSSVSSASPSSSSSSSSSPSSSPSSPSPLSTKLPSCVSILENPLGSTIYLVGVNHVSRQSSDDVQKVIQMVKPDTIFLELSRERLSSITYNGPLTLQPILLFSGVTAFVQSIIARVTFYQAAILDVRPGSEFKVALEEAKKSNIPLLLGDRVSDITWHRVVGAVSLFEVAKALPTYLRYARDITRLPTLDAMKQYLLEDMPSSAITGSNSNTNNNSNNSKDGKNDFPIPSVYPVIVKEKDLYLASVLRECRGKTIVAVVGSGHVTGITEHIKDKDDGYLLRAQLSRTPPLSQSPLAKQSALVGGAVVAGTCVLGALMARGLNRNRPTHKFRGTIPITLMLLALNVGGVGLWLSNEWLRMHAAITEAVRVQRENGELRMEKTKRISNTNDT